MRDADCREMQQSREASLFLQKNIFFRGLSERTNRSRLTNGLRGRTAVHLPGTSRQQTTPVRTLSSEHTQHEGHRLTHNCPQGRSRCGRSIISRPHLPACSQHSLRRARREHAGTALRGTCLRHRGPIWSNGTMLSLLRRSHHVGEARESRDQTPAREGWLLRLLRHLRQQKPSRHGRPMRFSTGWRGNWMHSRATSPGTRVPGAGPPHYRRGRPARCCTSGRASPGTRG